MNSVNSHAEVLQVSSFASVVLRMILLSVRNKIVIILQLVQGVPGMARDIFQHGDRDCRAGCISSPGHHLGRAYRQLASLFRFSLAILTLFLCACTSTNFGWQINQELRVGMTRSEASAALDRLEASGRPFIRRTNETVGAMCSSIKTASLCQGDPNYHLYMLYQDDQFPYDVLKQVDNGTPYLQVDFGSGAGMRSLHLFFSDKTQLLRGWLVSNGYWSARYTQERLGAKFRRVYGLVSLSRMTKAEVYALIGPPKKIMDPPAKLSRELFEDHYWDAQSAVPPTGKWSEPWEVYEYPLEDGSTRRVYLVYSKGKTLIAYGYDHAHLESDRYMRAHGF